MRRNQDGFTLVELLVVILIVGILSAIAVPAFLGQRARAQDTAAKTFARHAQNAVETHYQSGLTCRCTRPNTKGGCKAARTW